MYCIATIDSLAWFFRPLIGVAGLLTLAWLISSNRAKINPRVIVGGLLLQIVIAFGVLRVEWIASLFGMIAQLFAIALEVSVDASAFVFGPLANLEMMSQVFSNQGFVLHSWPY